MRGEYGSVTYPSRPVLDGDTYSVDIECKYPRVILDDILMKPQKVRFIDFGIIGQLHIDRIHGTILEKPKLFEIRDLINDKMELIQTSIEKALVKVGSNRFSQLPYPGQMHSPIIDIFSWLILNDKISIRDDIESLSKSDKEKYQLNMEILRAMEMIQIEGDLVFPGNYLIEIEKQGGGTFDKVSRALAYFFSNGYENIQSITHVLGPHLSISGHLYRTSFENEGIVSMSYGSIEERINIIYGSQIKRLRLPRYLMQLESVNIIESYSERGNTMWKCNDELFSDMMSQDELLSPITQMLA